MICNKCGKENQIDAKFCLNCENQLNNNIDNTQNILQEEQPINNFNNTNMNHNIIGFDNNIKTNIQPSNQNMQKGGFNKKQKLIIGTLCLIILIFGIVALFSLGSGDGTRTVMIYVVGSNLETNGGIVSADLAAITPEKIDLSKTNILLYTGGTEKWHNFVSNTENGLYILKSNGFEKLESQEQLNLGDPTTLANFMKYSYDNYKASKYDLILYNHGGAIDGAIYDDISGDNLSLKDMTAALEASPFNKNNKLDAILFRTCLNGTIEVANTFLPYANYLIGSEEISYGSSGTNVLGFLNDVIGEDTGKEFGEKFVQSYEKAMSIINPYGTVKQTYSVINLSKIDRVNKELDEYISGLDLSKNYIDIVKIRTNAYQYGASQNGSFDMIDLYNFVDKTSSLSTKDSKKLLAAIDDAIVRNSTNEENSHGLSIYFPYNGGKGQKHKFIDEVYTNLNYSNNYKEFINSFNNARSSAKSYSFTVTEKSVLDSEDNHELQLQLTDEQKNNYAFSTFTIFERDSEHPNYYKPIFNSDDTTLDDNGILKINYKDKLTKVIDDKTGEYQYALTYCRKQEDTRFTYGSLYDKNLKFSDDGYRVSATLYLKTIDDKLIISAAKLNSNNERVDGVLLNLDDYESYEIWTNTYRILDANGNVLNTSEWEPSPVYTGFGGELNDFELEYASLDKGDNYYALFIITDMSGNASYSKLIKIGEQ